MRGVFELPEPEGQRLELAIDLLYNRSCFVFAGVLIRRGERGEVTCEAVTQWQDTPLRNTVVQEDLGRARAACEQLRIASPRFASLVDAVSVRYAVIEDMDTSTLEVCREENGSLVWAPQGSRGGAA